MSGGKSSSSTETKTSQSTIASDASGVIAGDVFQGDIEFSGEFTPQVADAFQGLIELTNTAIQGAGNIAIDSISRVSERADNIDNPDLATTRSITPLVLAGIVVAGVVGIIFVWRK